MESAALNVMSYYKQYLFDKNKDKLNNKLKMYLSESDMELMWDCHYDEKDIMNYIVIIDLIKHLDNNSHEMVDCELNCWVKKPYTKEEINVWIYKMKVFMKYNELYKYNYCIPHYMFYPQTEEDKKKIIFKDYKIEIYNKIKLFMEFNDINKEIIDYEKLL
jgi:hypothetical protein